VLRQPIARQSALTAAPPADVEPAKPTRTASAARLSDATIILRSAGKAPDVTGSPPSCARAVTRIASFSALAPVNVAPALYEAVAPVFRSRSQTARTPSPVRRASWRWAARSVRRIARKSPADGGRP
jgi:hypothetical protein